MNKLVIIFVLFKLSSYFMLDLFNQSEMELQATTQQCMIEEAIELQLDSVNNFVEVLSVER
ncbi:hypothetical protein ACFLSQ_06475 [Bacteroidota bacterium]